MKAWRFLFLCLFCFSGCSDLGTGPDSAWIQYDLPYGHIFLPAELTRVQTMAAVPLNPEFVGRINGHTLRVQFCVNEFPLEFMTQRYTEESTTLSGRKAILFSCFGVFHLYDSHFSTMLGMKAYFRPDGNPVVVLASIENPESAEFARAILMTMRP